MKKLNVLELILFIFKAMIMLVQALLAFATVMFQLKQIWQYTCAIVGILALILFFVSIIEQVFVKVKGFAKT